MRQNLQHITSITKPVSKRAFKKKEKKSPVKVRVEKFASAFYAQYGEMMSKLSHE